jgi:hypothetical protein
MAMKIKIDRVISIATLTVSVVAVVLVLRKPQPVVSALPPAEVKANAESYQNKIGQLEQPKVPGQTNEVRLSAQEVNAALAQAAGALSGGPAPISSASTGRSQDLSGDLGAGEPDIKDYRVNFEGDIAKGQFLTRIAGKDVWVTLEGHLSSKDGYATLEPTKIKVGDLEIPVSLVNDQLQKRLMEQRDRLKLPESVSGIKVENGEVVLTK